MNKKKKASELRDFEVTGEFQEKGKTKKFLFSIKANSANYAAEKALCIIGSKHKKPRRNVLVREVREKRVVL